MPDYPKDCIQDLLGAWWINDPSPGVHRGRLLRAFVPHVDSVPMRLVVEGRSGPTEHERANYRVESFDVTKHLTAPDLPVAAMPHRKDEERFVYKGKVRPVLVLGAAFPEVPRNLRIGAAHWQTARTIMVAPYYGVDQDGTRAGWRPDLVARIRRATWPQYLWDKLPLGGRVSESVLRLDHIQPVGLASESYQWTPHRLCEQAMNIVDQWVEWALTSMVRDGGDLADALEMMAASPSSALGGPPTPSTH